jgi:hypothetical protein
MSSDQDYDAAAEQVHLFKRLGICGELATLLSTTLKNTDISKYVDDSNIEASRERVREIQYLLLVLADALSAAMVHTTVPSNEALIGMLEWCKAEALTEHEK